MSLSMKQELARLQFVLTTVRGNEVYRNGFSLVRLELPCFCVRLRGQDVPAPGLRWERSCTASRGSLQYCICKQPRATIIIPKLLFKDKMRKSVIPCTRVCRDLGFNINV